MWKLDLLIWKAYKPQLQYLGIAWDQWLNFRNVWESIIFAPDKFKLFDFFCKLSVTLTRPSIQELSPGNQSYPNILSNPSHLKLVVVITSTFIRFMTHSGG